MVFLNPPPSHTCECNCAAALREENARLKAEVARLEGLILDWYAKGKYPPPPGYGFAR